MWHTEFGYSSSTGENSANMSVGDEYKQAEMIIRLMDEIKRDNPQDVTYIYEMSSDGTDLTDREDNFELIRSCYAENPYSAKFAYLAVANYNSLTANATTISRVESGNNITGGNYITKYEKDGCNVYLLRTTNGSGSTTRYDFGSENLYYYDLFGNKLEESDVKSGDAYKLTTVPYYIVSGEDVNRAEPENDTRMRAGEFVIRGRIPSGEENKKISVTLTDENAVFGTDSFEDDVFFWNQGVTGLNGTFEFTAKVYEKDHIKAHIVTEDDEMIVLEQLDRYIFEMFTECLLFINDNDDIILQKVFNIVSSRIIQTRYSDKDIWEFLRKQNKDISKLTKVVDTLSKGEKLSLKYRDHQLYNDEKFKNLRSAILNQIGY